MKSECEAAVGAVVALVALMRLSASIEAIRHAVQTRASTIHASSCRPEFQENGAYRLTRVCWETARQYNRVHL